jgi:putative peptidoglycan lipid II flippase
MSSLKKTAILITIITLGSKVLGFAREIILAYFYGTSYIVDCYLMASAIPSMLFGWLNSVGVSYIPIYTEIKANNGEENANKFTNNLISIIFLASIFLAILGLMFGKQIVSVAAPGFKGETYDLTVSFLNVSIWTVIFTSLVQVFMAYLNCNDKFIQSNISNLVISSTQMFFIFLGGLFNDYIIIYGVLFSHIMHLVALSVFSKNSGFRFKFNAQISNEIKKAFIIAGPIFVSSMIIQINLFIDKTFASQLNEGSISALNYSANIHRFVFYIFSIAITTMIYPLLSKSIAENNIIKVKNLFSKALNIIIILFVPVTIGAIILSKPAISFVYERGKFGYDSTIMTSSAFVMYTIGLLPLAAREIVTRVFYSLQDTKITMYISMFAVLINIFLNFLLVKPLGHSGLALATSLSAIITLPLLFIMLRKKIGNLGLKNSIILLIKSCISGTLMGVAVYFSYKYFSGILGNGSLYLLINIIISVLIGGLTYFGLMIVMKVKEMNFFTDIIIIELKKLRK